MAPDARDVRRKQEGLRSMWRLSEHLTHQPSTFEVYVVEGMNKSFR